MKLQFENLNNTRDLCDLKTGNGKSIVKGTLYRSGRLGDASESDLQKLNALGLKTVIDLRSEIEMMEKSDPVLPGVNYTVFHIIEDPTSGIEKEEGKSAVETIMTKAVDDENYGFSYMMEMYRDFIHSSHVQQEYSKFFRLLSECEGPVLWHCTSGKDRCGLASIYLEEILGVDRSDIIADYLLTGKFMSEELDERAKIVRSGTDNPILKDRFERFIRDFFGTREEYILEAYKEMNKLCGSVEKYLEEKIGISAEMKEKIQNKYLKGENKRMFENIVINAHSSICLKGENVVYIDPFKIEETVNDADIICITHSHFDHFSPEDIEKIKNENTVFVAPLSMKEDMEKAKLVNCVLLNPGESIDIDGVNIEAVVSYNTNKPMHPKENKWLGYIIEIEGTKIYIAGDTDAIEEGRNFGCDIAMVPCGGTYTMDAKEAAEYINMIHPKMAIPTHYGSITGTSEDGNIFKENVDKEIEVRILIK